MLKLFPDHPEAVHESGRIAEKCIFEMEFGATKLPRFVLTERQSELCGRDNIRFFRRLCASGLKKRYPVVTQMLKERLEYELDTVIKMGYTDYYLIVWDFIRFARSKDIPVGPGRGSGAGSLAAYCIGITDIDPIKYNLIFERFLNPERVSMPDFDIDFCYERRQEVIDYVIGKYGEDHVSMIVTFGTMAAKMAVRDITRVTGLPYSLGEQISRLIPQAPHISLREAIESSKELKELYNNNADARTVLDYSMMVEGMPRNTSTHAAGVVICDAPVSDYVPVIQRNGVIAAQYTMTELEQLGLLKMDFLGLRNLTVIHYCERDIRKHEPDFSSKNIPEDDRETFEMLSAGDSFGVFQFESDGMRDLLTRLRPESIEDLTAALSLYRPGPMESIPRYIQNRKNPEAISYKVPCLEPILSVTYGCIVYQEQVMQICREMSGYSYGRADNVRRAMAKKKAAQMEKERPEFIKGAAERGISEKLAAEVFDEIAGFASYAFNKSHAAAYSVVAYTTAYLKRHYFKEYVSAMMTVFCGYQAKLNECISECKKRGIKLLLPNINESGTGFTPCENGIRFSLLAAKNLGPAVIERIIAEREENGKYTNLSDLIRRVPSLTIRNAEALIKCGALDSMPHNRAEYLNNLEKIFSSVSRNLSGKIDGQLDFFSSSGEHIPDAEESIAPMNNYPAEMLTEMELEILGMYVSGHPLDRFNILACAAGAKNTAQIRKLQPNEKLRLLCIVSSIKEHSTKKGDTMAFLTVEDSEGSVEVIMFHEAYNRSMMYCRKGMTIFIDGHTSTDRDGNINIIADSAASGEEFIGKCQKAVLYIRTDSRRKDVIEKCAAILSASHGTQRVIFNYPDRNISISNKKCPTTAVTPELISELINAAGTENIRLKLPE